MSAQQLKLRLMEVKSLDEPGVRLQEYEDILSGIGEIEMSAAMDMTFPLGEIQDARALIPEVQAGINRLKAGLARSLRRREEEQ